MHFKEGMENSNIIIICEEEVENSNIIIICEEEEDSIEDKYM